MRGHRNTALCCCGVILAAANGCSLVAVKRPPSEPVNPEALRCTSSPVPAIIDGVMALASAAAVVVLVANATSCSPSNDPGCQLSAPGRTFAGAGLGLLGAVVPVTFLVSAVYGARETSRCGELNRWKDAVAVDPSVPWPVEKPAAEEGESPAIQEAPRPIPRRPPEKVPKNGRCEDDGDCAEGLVCPMGWCIPR